MRVIHVLNELKYSGAEFLLASGANYIMADGRHTALSTGVVLGDYAPELERAGYDLAHLGFARSLRYFWSLFRLLRQYDLIHIHAERASFWHGLLGRMAGKPCIRTIHNEFAFEGALRLRRRLGRQLSAAMGVRHVACSVRVAHNERERFGIETMVIDNWLDPRRIQLATPEARLHARRQLGIPEAAFVIVSVGNYGPAKNHEAIVEATRDCARTLPIHYYHCGAGGHDLRERMKVRPEEPIHMQGAVSNIGDYLAAADAFVAASFNEGGQVSLLEAAAAGLPCITTRVGLAESLDGLPGIDFVESSPPSVADGIRSVRAKTLDRRMQDGAELSRSVLAHFVPGVGAARYATLYRELLDAPIPAVTA